MKRNLKIGDVVDIDGTCEVVAFPERGVTVFNPLVQQRTMKLALWKPPHGKVKMIRISRNVKVTIPKGQYIDFYI